MKVATRLDPAKRNGTLEIVEHRPWIGRCRRRDARSEPRGRGGSVGKGFAMDSWTLDLMNVRSRRMPRIGQLIVMALATAAVSLVVQDPVIAAVQDSIQLRSAVPTTAESRHPKEPEFLVRTARVPIFVDINLGASGGTPTVPVDVVDRVVATLDANPRRLIT